MGKRLVYKKPATNNTPKHINRTRVLTKMKTSEGWATYRAGNFWIGQKMISRYRPKRKERVVSGIFFNADAGRFEAWKDSQKIGEMGWRVGQPALLEWAKKFS